MGINKFLQDKLKLELHKDKSKIMPLRNRINFLGYRIFYYYKLLRKRNIKNFEIKFNTKIDLYKEGLLDYENIIGNLQGWFGYAMWANTYKFREILRRVKFINQPKVF